MQEADKKAKVPQPKDDGQINMLNEIQFLFRALETHKKSSGRYDHIKFIKAIKKANALFDNDEHHDSHEYVNWLLDELHESFIRARSERPDPNSHYGPRESFVSEFFEG